MLPAEICQIFYKFSQPCFLLLFLPVQPAGLIVLTVGIVFPQIINVSFSGISLHATVTAVIETVSITVIFPVLQIVFFTVGKQIPQCKSIIISNVIDKPFHAVLLSLLAEKLVKVSFHMVQHFSRRVQVFITIYI